MKASNKPLNSLEGVEGQNFDAIHRFRQALDNCYTLKALSVYALKYW